MFRFVLTAAAAVLLMGCNTDGIRGEIINKKEPDIDELGPIIEHDPVTESQLYGEDIFLEAWVFDDRINEEGELVDTGVAVVEVLYRQETSVEFKSRGFTPVGGGLYQGTIRGQDVASGGMRYYLEATDLAGNRNCLPEECEDETWRFSVIPPS